MEDHRITRMVQFGGAVFFETDDFTSKLGGVTARTLACCIAQSNTIFKAYPSPINNLSFLAMKMLAINGQPIQTLDAFIALIPKLIQQKYFTIEYINCINTIHGAWVLYAHDRYKDNVAIRCKLSTT